MSQSVFGRKKKADTSDAASPMAAPPASDGGGHGRKGSAQPAIPLDPLTGLPTRASLGAIVERAVHRSHGSSSKALVVFVDIGLMRNVNDTYGPDLGDHLLREVARRLSTIDVPGVQVLRWEGAEFVLVFEKMTQGDAGEKIGEFITELLAPAFQVGHDSITIECYVGGAVSDDAYGAGGDLIRDAHQSVIEAQDRGHATVVIWDESQRNRYATRITDDRLQQAVDESEFVLHWQPVVRLTDNDMVAAEALIRWKSPNTTTAGVLFPHDFLPQLERSGLIVPVGKWVINETCRQVAEWTANNPDHRVVFGICNLGGRQLAQTDFAETVITSIRDAGIEPWQLCLDLTEVALAYNRTAIWGSLRELKNLGVKLGLDDFGTGESSVSYLREFAVDMIRLDKRFIDGVGKDREDVAIIKHLSALAHDLDLLVVAEGVETPEQANALRDLEVDLAQGYLFGKPEYPSVIDLLMKPESERRPTGWDPSEVMESSLLEHDAGAGATAAPPAPAGPDLAKS